MPLPLPVCDAHVCGLEAEASRVRLASAALDAEQVHLVPAVHDTAQVRERALNARALRVAGLGVGETRRRWH